MATKTTKTPAKPKRSKAEIEQEFTDIREEVATARETADLKAEETARLHDSEVRRAVEGISVEGVVRGISGLGLEVSKALADLSEKIVQEVNRLASVREAVELDQKELTRLHKIDVSATALDQMVQDYARKKGELESEIADQRAAWEEESRQSERDRKEMEEALKKQRQREIDEYDYKKNLERKKAQDRYEEEVKLQEKVNKEKQELLEKSWQQREAALKEREDDLARLRKEAEEFPVRLQKACEKAAADAGQAASQKFDQQILLLEKDSDGERRVSELRIKILEDAASQHVAQITALQKQLDEAKQQVQEIAVKAIEGASGARALSHINEIAMEQAKHRSPQG